MAVKRRAAQCDAVQCVHFVLVNLHAPASCAHTHEAPYDHCITSVGPASQNQAELDCPSQECPRVFSLLFPLLCHTTLIMLYYNSQLTRSQPAPVPVLLLRNKNSYDNIFTLLQQRWRHGNTRHHKKKIEFRIPPFFRNKTATTILLRSYSSGRVVATHATQSNPTQEVTHIL